MKRPIALLLMLAMCVTLVLPFATLTVGAATAQAEDGFQPGAVLWETDFDSLSGSSSDNSMTALNGVADTYGLAEWSMISSTTLNSSGVTISDGALQLSAGTLLSLEVQLFGGDAMKTFVKENDFTLEFDATYTSGSSDDYMAIRLSRVDENNLMETAVELRGKGHMVAKSGGTSYSLEEDGYMADKYGSVSKGHSLGNLVGTGAGTTTLLTHLNKATDGTITDTYDSSATPLKNQTLHYRLESIHGAGLILSINGVVVSTTGKNVYYHDLLSGQTGTISLFLSAGTKATIDNLSLTAGGAYTITTNELGLKILDVNTLFSHTSDYSMHWIVDENGRIRMDALLSVIELQDPDIIGMQERSFQDPTSETGTSAENTIVETLEKMGYGMVGNKVQTNAVDRYGRQSRYSTYNWQPIFYKTSKFIMMNDLSREDEFVEGGDLSLVTNETNGTLIFDQAHTDVYRTAYSTDKTYTVQLLIGDQVNTIDTSMYKAVTTRYLGRIYAATDAAQKTATELHYVTDVPTAQDPVLLSSTSGWLDVSAFSDTELAAVTYDSSTGKVVYDGTSYTGAYYRRYAVDEVIAVMLTDSARYNPDSSTYRVFHSGLDGVSASYFNDSSTNFPLGHTAKTVTELRNKGDSYYHTDYTPVTLTEAQMQETTDGNPSYLNVTFFTQEEYDNVVMSQDGTTACTYNGVTYKGMYYVRARMDGVAGQTDSKGLTWSVLKMRDGGQELLVINAHCALLMSSQNPLTDGNIGWTDAAEWRMDNARQILEVYNKVVEKHGALPTIVTGDFNMQNSDPMYAKLSAEFDDSARLAPGVVYWEYSHHTSSLVLTKTTDTDGNTVYYYNEGDISHLTYPDPNYPIDHVFVSPNDFTVTRYNVLNDTRDELLMTDHCGLVVELTYNRVFTPACSKKSGIYQGAQAVTFTAAHTADAIYYTTDGSDPRDEASSARKLYTGEFVVSGDLALKFAAYRDGVYSDVSTVNFSTCADIAITEIICNPKGADGGYADIQEGFEVVNVSNHPIDLSDYIFWCQQVESKTLMQDGNIVYRYDMGHMRTSEVGKYILQPGEVAFMWTVMDDAYKNEFQYTTGASAYAMEFVTAEKLADPTLRESDWEALGYTGLTEDSIGKVIYRKDLVAQYFSEQTGSSITADKIVPLDKTTAAGIYKNTGTDTSPVWEVVEARKDIVLNSSGTAKGVTLLSNSFNMGNSVFTRMFVTYADAITAEDYFATAYLDDEHGAADGMTINATTGKPSIKEGGTFTMQPELDRATGKVTSYATAYNALTSGTISIGALNTDSADESQKQDVSLYVDYMTENVAHVTVNTGDTATSFEIDVEKNTTFPLPTAQPTGDGVFAGWESSTGKLYSLGAELTVTDDLTIDAFFMSFATLPGASMRTTKGSVGMRFSTAVTVESYNKLTTLLGDDASTLAMGTFIVPEAYVEKVGGFDIDAFPLYLDVATTAFRSQDETYCMIAGSVANIYENHYRMAYAGCGYFRFTYADGVEALLYAECPLDDGRTIVGVAAQAYNDRSLTETEHYKYYCATENNYSPYSETQLERIRPYIADVCFVSFAITCTGEALWNEESYTIRLTGTSVGIDATCVYDGSADVIVITRLDGESWSVTEAFVNGALTSCTVDGSRLLVPLDSYTPEY